MQYIVVVVGFKLPVVVGGGRLLCMLRCKAFEV